MRNSGKPIAERIRENTADMRDYPIMNSSWDVNQTPLEQVERELHIGISKRIEAGLRANRKVVVLDSGCDQQATALVELAGKYREAVRSGKLELHGLHLACPGRFAAASRELSRFGIRLHNLTPLEFRGLGVRPSIIFDFYGAVYHSAAYRLSKLYGQALVRSLARGGVMALRMDIPGPFVARNQVTEVSVRYDPRKWNMRDVRVKYKSKHVSRPAENGAVELASRVFHISK
jgi:hypothetical protein